MLIIQYIILFLIVLLVCCIATIKILYPFWNLQPTLHPYDFWRHFSLLLNGGKGFIITDRIIKNEKYIDLFKVKTELYEKIADETKQQIISLLGRKYIDSEKVFFLVDSFWLDNLLNVGHDAPSMISYGYPIPKGGCCVSYSIMIYNGGSGGISVGGGGISVGGEGDGGAMETPAYFIDLFTAEDIKPTILFQTHEYKQRLLNSAIKVSLFKKEITPFKGITPFISTDTYLYPILKGRLEKLKGDIFMIQKNGQHSQYLYDFLRHFPFKGGCSMVSLSFSAIMNWVKNGIWFVFLFVRDDALLSIYFFRDTYLQYEEFSELDTNTRCIELVSCFNNTKNVEMFYNGFLLALKHLTLKVNLDFRLLQIPDIGHNGVILEGWKRTNTCLMKTFLGYYFFNYCWKLKGGDNFVFIL